MKVSIAQINPLIGALEENSKKILNIYKNEAQKGSDLVVFPELSLWGYPPLDFLERKWLIENSERVIKEMAKFTKRFTNTALLFGAPRPTFKKSGRGLYNSAIVLYQGEIIFQQNKSLLPNYDVFEEERYFDKAENIEIFEFKNEKIGVSICEDAWYHAVSWEHRLLYEKDPINELYKKGATLLINLSASPYQLRKSNIRYKLLKDHCTKYKLPFIYVNQVGGNDELIFDGRSKFLDSTGKIVTMLKAYKEDIQLVDTNFKGEIDFKEEDLIKSAYDALVLGVKDYMRKTGFKTAVLGISGGIDSALTAVIACDAIGSENVFGITMPSKYSSKSSIEDSKKLCKNLKMNLKIIPITTIYNEYLKLLDPYLNDAYINITKENLQARIRGNILMAFSNEYNHLLLSTGNKSELAVGYCTLYGDMSGGLCVLSDIPKTLVYKLSEFINRDREIIPCSIINKAPSAELKPNQYDQDTLPPYDILDSILEYYIEDGLSPDGIINKGFNPETVNWVIKKVEFNEYKRKQAALGIKITSKAFGRGRKIPIAAKHLL